MKRIIFIGVALALIVGLVGCGSSGGTETKPSTETETRTNPPAPEGEKGTPEATKPGMEGAPKAGAKKPSGDPNYKPKPAVGDATKFKGVYVMASTPLDKKIDKALASKKKPPFYGEVTIVGDGNYEFKFGPKGKEAVTKGTTQVDGDKVTLTPALVDGKTPMSAGAQTAIPATLSKDGKTLTLHLKQEGVGGGDMKYIKK